MRIDIWSDIVCPWCYIGKRRLERALAGFEHRDRIEIVHRSFQLDPASPRGTIRSHRDNLMSKYGMSQGQADATQARMEQTAAGEGLEFRLVGGMTGNTFDAHRLLRLAWDRGIQGAVLERLYRAHFTEQRSIFKVESLAALGADAGLDAGEAVGVLRGDVYADAVEADLHEARRHGILGVPHYLFDGNHAVSGAQPTEVFAAALTRAWAARVASN